MENKEYMKNAIVLAAKGRTSPNPKVGCVIVINDRIIGAGYHKKAGEPHAEVEALQNARQKTEDLHDATIYLTLEPCSHVWDGKKTGACADAIIDSGIRNVIIAMKDPNPKVNGRGIEKLKNAGIEVEVGLLEEEAKELNMAYIKHAKTGMPYVAMKMAMSLDGKIAARTGESKWISGEESREAVQQMRNDFDAVMVGAGTILKDNPSLTCRIPEGHDPMKVIVDSELRVPFNAKFMAEPSRVVIAATERANKIKINKFQKLGARVIVCGKEKVDLNALMHELAKTGVQSVLLEGGSELNASALEARIVDKLYFFIAPKIIGGKEAKGPVGGRGIEKMSEALNLKKMKIKKIGNDLLIEAEI